MKTWIETMVVLVLAVSSAALVAQGQPAHAELSVAHVAAEAMPQTLWPEADSWPSR
jgi:hypothetical protein